MRYPELLATAVTPAGEPIGLWREGPALVVRVRREVLMSTRMHGSEEALAEVGCAGLRDRPAARVLIGGLGMGFTLRAALDALGPAHEVVVRELIPALVDWNRGPLGEAAGRPLDDPRVTMEIGDVAQALTPDRYDAILLDVDNGPEAVTVPSNGWLYGAGGLGAARRALRPGGALVVWSASDSPSFPAALAAAGLQPDVLRVRGRAGVRKGPRHVLYRGRRAS